MGTPLGDFVRSRRDATPPSAVGLPTGARRRAPGLRRSELASLSGISVEYLARIEQGTDRHPSPAVVNALADALRLDAAQREHLRHLAKISGDTCLGARHAEAQARLGVRPAVRAMVEMLEPGVALVRNRLGDVLAHTSGFELVARPSGLLDGRHPNLTRFVFGDPRAREVFPDWDAVADRCAFDLWFGPTVERATELAAELTEIAGDEFTRRHGRPDLPADDVLRWVHPTAGTLQFDREVLELPAGDAQQLVVLLPATDATADALQQLRLAAAAPLRAVQ
jgi:transcriptional regulator with XRE-family HTH domain